MDEIDAYQRAFMTPDQEAARNDLAQRLENTILEWVHERAVNSIVRGGDIVVLFEAVMSLFSGRLAFIDTMFEQWCLDKYCPLPPRPAAAHDRRGNTAPGILAGVFRKWKRARRKRS